MVMGIFVRHAIQPNIVRLAIRPRKGRALVLFLLFLFLLTDYVEGGMYVKGIFSHHQQSGQWNCYEEMRGT